MGPLANLKWKEQIRKENLSDMYNIMEVRYKNGRKYKPQLVKEFKRKADAERSLKRSLQAVKAKYTPKVDLCTNTVYAPCGYKVQFVIEKAASTSNGQGCNLLTIPISAVSRSKKVKN